MGLLSRELGECEEQGGALLFQQQLVSLRLLADARCVASEVRAAEAEREAAAANGAMCAPARRWKVMSSENVMRRVSSPNIE